MCSRLRSQIRRRGRTWQTVGNTSTHTHIFCILTYQHIHYCFVLYIVTLMSTELNGYSCNIFGTLEHHNWCVDASWTWLPYSMQSTSHLWVNKENFIGLTSCMPVCVLSHCRVWLFATSWTVACQAPLSMDFARQEHWSGLPFPPLGDLPEIFPTQGFILHLFCLLYWQADSLPLYHLGSPSY